MNFMFDYEWAELHSFSHSFSLCNTEQNIPWLELIQAILPKMLYQREKFSIEQNRSLRGHN